MFWIYILLGLTPPPTLSLQCSSISQLIQTSRVCTALYFKFFGLVDSFNETVKAPYDSCLVFPERCRQEIDEVLEGKAHAAFEDRLRMPYTQAVIHESQRIANTVPLSVFHCTTKDTELMGYSIPKVKILLSFHLI